MTTPCPPWCEQIQCREPHPPDRYHQTSKSLPLVLRRYNGALDRGEAIAVDAAAVLFTSAVQPDELWFAIDLGEEGAGLTLSAESAARLQMLLSRLLAAAREG